MPTNYQGLLAELDSALTTYSALEGYDAEDLIGAVHDVREEIKKLRHFHGRVWDLFRPVKNKKDMEAMEQFLGDEAIRQDFYGRLRAFSRCLHISLSSDRILDVFDEAQIAEMKRDWRSFSDLRKSVRIRYQEAVDVREFEPKIKRLLDDHVSAKPAETVIKLIDIHDTGVLKSVISLVKIGSKVARGHEEREMLAALRGNNHGMAFYGIFSGVLAEASRKPVAEDETAEVVLAVMDIIHDRHIVDVWSNETAQNDMRNAIDDYFYDVLRDKKGIELTEAQMDDLQAQILRLAQRRFP